MPGRTSPAMTTVFHSTENMNTDFKEIIVCGGERLPLDLTEQHTGLRPMDREISVVHVSRSLMIKCLVKRILSDLRSRMIT